MNIDNQGLVEGPFLFVVNPNSGTGGYKQFVNLTRSIQSVRKFDLVESQSPQHSVELAQKAADHGYAAVVAVGGDGSVHEIGVQLIGTQTALGIIPTGSGNGIARHLGLSLQVGVAIREMLIGKTRTIDTLTVNNEKAIGFCGIGFDAHVANLFDKATERGFSNYVKLTMDAFNDYEATEFQMCSTNHNKTIKAFTVILANINQFGNNAQINPKAIDDDGLFELVAVTPFPVTSFPSMASRLFMKSFHKSKFVSTEKLSEVVIKNPGNALLQIDGEPRGCVDQIKVEIAPKSLNVIIP
ncbi:MAG: diacylglycerol kinase family protein [Flavobacteriales bacterium]